MNNAENKVIELLNNGIQGNSMYAFESPNADKKKCEEISKALEDAVNGFCIDHTEFLKKIKEDVDFRTYFIVLALRWIYVVSNYKDWQYDGRNEQAYIMCSKISTLDEYKSLVDLYDIDKESNTIYTDFAKYVSDYPYHRYLHLSITGLLFNFIHLALPGLDKEITEMYQYDEWYKVG